MDAAEELLACFDVATRTELATTFVRLLLLLLLRLLRLLRRLRRLRPRRRHVDDIPFRKSNQLVRVGVDDLEPPNGRIRLALGYQPLGTHGQSIRWEGPRKQDRGEGAVGVG